MWLIGGGNWEVYEEGVERSLKQKDAEGRGKKLEDKGRVDNEIMDAQWEKYGSHYVVDRGRKQGRIRRGVERSLKQKNGKEQKIRKGKETEDKDRG